MFSAFDKACMAQALHLGTAQIAVARPNPSVGCVIAQGERIIGQGATQAYGGDHAEQDALQACTASAEGATVYVTLEPCNAVGASGRHASCTDSLIAARVGRLVIGVRDTNPAVNGQGIARLQAAGIRVDIGLLAPAIHRHHIGFLTRMQRGTPWVRAKMAASLDGRTALANGTSQWITGTAARTDGHAFRARACAVLAGSGTLRVDNPQLTVRHVPVARQPLRVLVDHLDALTPDLRVFEAAGTDAPILIVNAGKKTQVTSPFGPQVSTVSLPDARGRVDLRALLQHLGGRKVNELHLEAGARLTGALIAEGLVDELLVYLAPRLIGQHGKELFTLPKLDALPDAPAWRIFDVAQVGDDVRLRLEKRA
jgi:diaminohydroxyphosphoribosylaminopyrimidine deaminase / 5-amino-6-(5-phosphoribosylamino)uracil reductase